MLRAAMSAPSAANAQTWTFIVIDDQKMLEKIPTFSPYAGMCREAPLAILICGDKTLEKVPGYWVQDCSAATQNLLLAAHACGLPENVIPLSFVPVGYPDQEPGVQDRFDRKKVYYNTYGKREE